MLDPDEKPRVALDDQRPAERRSERVHPAGGHQVEGGPLCRQDAVGVAATVGQLQLTAGDPEQPPVGPIAVVDVEPDGRPS
jgi:hypothetical protein